MSYCSHKITDCLTDLIQKLLSKDPGHRLMLPEIKVHPWVTRKGSCPMLTEEENCHLVTVTEEEVKNSLKVVPRLGKSFLNVIRDNANITDTFKIH